MPTCNPVSANYILQLSQSRCLRLAAATKSSVPGIFTKGDGLPIRRLTRGGSVRPNLMFLLPAVHNYVFKFQCCQPGYLDLLPDVTTSTNYSQLFELSNNNKKSLYQQKIKRCSEGGYLHTFAFLC